VSPPDWDGYGFPQLSILWTTKTRSLVIRHRARMDPVEVLRHLGGTAGRADLLRHAGRRALDRALTDRLVERVSWGRYALPGLPPALKTARGLSGVLSHESAAEYWLLESVARPTTVHVTVPPQAHRPAVKGVTLHYSTIGDEEVTSPLRTVLDCARTLPFREGLAIADSALRRDLVTRGELVEAARRLTNRGSRRARDVAECSTAAAANPLESALRAVVIDAGLEGFEAQLVIAEDGLSVRVDLGHPALRLVAEADSFEFHGSRSALDRDCRRYDELVSRGWLVLRFSWEQVMFDPGWVRAKLIETYRLRAAQSGGLARPKTRIRG
jgi:very-short-patch-repair endonuclease